MLDARHITRIFGRYWRAGFIGNEASLLAPAGAPRGRWHHKGQQALYLSGSPEGCQVALRVYVDPQDPPRGIFPFLVHNAAIVDLRRPDTREILETSLEEIHAFWADLHAKGQPSPTWALSDRLRDESLDGLLTPSRSRPDLTHLTLFSWNDGRVRVTQAGSHLPFDPNYGLGVT